MRRVFLVTALLVQGCASFNTNYKANQYADEARRLDREGRTLEAGGYWGRASVKADSLLAHSPDGKYAAGALAIKGEAYASVGQCGQASRVLPSAIERLKNEADREYATIALAFCELRLGSPVLAASTVLPVTESHDGGRRRQALLLLGDRGAPGRPGLRCAACPGGYSGVAGACPADARVCRVHMTRWPRPARSIHWWRCGTRRCPGIRCSPSRAALIRNSPHTSPVRLSRSRTLSLEKSAALSFADASRLATVDTVRQRQRYEDIVQMAGRGEIADRARFDMARMRIRAADSMADLTATLEAMQAIAASDGSVAATLAPLRNQIQQLQLLMDSTAPGEPRGDMRRFLAAEFARDTLDAQPLAASLFESIPQGWPESPYAAKAWLAGRQLTGDTSAANGQFTSSPYMAVLRGEEGATYTQLEDSLANFARTLAAASRSPGRRRGGRRRSAQTGPSSPTMRTRPRRAAARSAHALRRRPGARPLPRPGYPRSNGWPHARFSGRGSRIPSSSPRAPRVTAASLPV